MVQVNKKIVVIDDIGEVLLERSARTHRISLTVKSRGGVRVAVPRGVSFELAARFACSKSQWIHRQREQLLCSAQRADLLCQTPLNPDHSRSELKHRLAELAQRHGYAYGRVFIRNQQTRWGSCSGRNNINLSINLVRLPAELMDYVLLHELVHTRVKNHGPLFWSELGRLIANARGLDRLLDDYRGLLGRK
jgi:predicted metal-dependent hydrolase